MIDFKTAEEFDNLVATENVVVDFWSPQCGPCRGLAPIYKEFAERNPDVKIGKINILESDEMMKIAARYKIMAIPAVLYFKKGGSVLDRINGLTNMKALEGKLTHFKDA